MNDTDLTQKWNVLRERAGFWTGLLFFLWPLLFSRETSEAMWVADSGPYARL